MSNTTTVVRGWKLTRRDGAIMAFTDCDIDLTVDGVSYEASAALTPSEAVSSLGMAVDEQEVQGGINSNHITEVDLAAGLYDGATVEVIEIDWSTVTRHSTVGVYYIGEVNRTEVAFTAELRSQAGVLAQKRGRYLMGTCDAELGDARCGVDTAPLAGSGVVASSTSETGFLVTGLEAHIDGTFSAGTLVWTSGDNLGQSHDVRNHLGTSIGLWRPPLFGVSASDGFDIFPGCDKSFLTCKDRFFNGDNHRGFPAVVGEDAFKYASNGSGTLDGGARNDF